MKVVTNDNYSLEISLNGLEPEILVRSLTNPKNTAVHQYFFLQDEEGLFRKQKLTNENIDAVVREIKERGVTSGLYLKPKTQRTNQSKYTQFRSASPAIRHKLTTEESSFTSTGEKLASHWPIFHKYRDTGYGSIIRATMTLHQVSASNCSFCSTINRTRKDSISLEEAQNFIRALDEEQAAFNQSNFSEYNNMYRELTGSDIKLRGLILSGGGQPNLWPHFSDFVGWLSSREIDLGLITNGFPKHVSDEIYTNFKWIRLSITPEDASPFYPDQQFDKQYIPEFLATEQDITFGLSYVYGPWTSDEMLKRLDDAAHRWNADYVRLLADCNLPRELQLDAHRDLAERLYSLKLIDSHGMPISKIFHQLKYHSCSSEIADVWDDNQCKLQIYNTFWDTTGHEEHGASSCYPCDSVTVLADDYIENVSERRFNADKWGTVNNLQVKKLYTEKVQPFFNPNEICGACLFVKNNHITKKLINRNFNEFTNIPYKSNLSHSNFP